MKKILIVTAVLAVSALSAMDKPEGSSSSNTASVQQKKASARQRRLRRAANRAANRRGGRIGNKILKHNAKNNSATAALFLSAKAKKTSDAMKFAFQALENAYTKDQTTDITMGSVFTTFQFDSVFLTPTEKTVLLVLQEAQERYAVTKSIEDYSLFDALRIEFLGSRTNFQEFGDWNWQATMLQASDAVIIAQMLAKHKIPADVVLVQALIQNTQSLSQKKEANKLLLNILSKKLTFDINAIRKYKEENSTLYDIVCDINNFRIAELIVDLGGKAYKQVIAEQTKQIAEQRKQKIAQLKAKRNEQKKKNKQ